jgi:hypothetical protein
MSIIKIGRYKFKHGPSKKEIQLDPLSLTEIKSKDYEHQLPKGKLLLKKPDYALFKVSRTAPIVDRMLKLTKNTQDDSKSFMVLYVGNAFVGYKSAKTIKFIPSFSKKNYISILEKYKPRKPNSSRRKRYPGNTFLLS